MDNLAIPTEAGKIWDMAITQCNVCSKSFFARPRGKDVGRGKYCSRSCFYIGFRKYPKELECKNCKITFSNSDSQNRQFCGRECADKARLGQASYARSPRTWVWIGRETEYKMLHRWVNDTLGKPTTCEHCHKEGLTGRKIHWANKSHKYMKEPSDWIRLCAKCHKVYDRV